MIFEVFYKIAIKRLNLNVKTGIYSVQKPIIIVKNEQEYNKLMIQLEKEKTVLFRYALIPAKINIYRIIMPSKILLFKTKLFEINTYLNVSRNRYTPKTARKFNRILSSINFVFPDEAEIGFLFDETNSYQRYKPIRIKRKLYDTQNKL